LAAAGFLNFGDLIEVFKPWVDYGLTIAAQQGGNAQQAAAFREPAMAVLDLLRCARTFSSVTYVQGEAAVTHFEWVIQDLQ
jgi:hypothetical protein